MTKPPSAPICSLGYTPSIQRQKTRLFGRELPPAPSLDTRPDWEQAEPGWIHRALDRSQALPSGGWYVLDASRDFGQAPRRVWLLGRPLVVWRVGSQLFAAPDFCPHLAAPLSQGRVCDGQLVCPWHGQQLGPEGKRGFRPLTSYDDGYLFWVRLNGSEAPTDPILPTRPGAPLDATIRVEATCEPRDIIANRLDPWHGTYLHPS